MQFPFALVLFLPIPLSFAHYFSGSRLLTSFLCPCFTRVPSPVSGLARGATWESEAHHRFGTRFRGSEQDAIQCVQTQSHCHGLCPLGPSTQEPPHSSPLSPLCLPGISSMEARTYWNNHWGQSALFGSKVGPLSCHTRLFCFPNVRGPQSLWGQKQPRIFCKQTKLDDSPRNRHPGTAPGCLSYQGSGAMRRGRRMGKLPISALLSSKSPLPALPSGSEKVDLETCETQGSRRRETDIPRRGSINGRTNRQMNLKGARQRLGVARKEKLSAGVRQAEIGD